MPAVRPKARPPFNKVRRWKEEATFLSEFEGINVRP